MNNPLISIIIPVYNVEGFLHECLDSIVKQSFGNYEVILVDDGSTDSSPIICDQYAERYSNVHVIHKENGGVSSARNVALDIAVGQWIWFVDADDWVDEQSLEVLYNTVTCHTTDIVYFGLDQVGESKIWHGSSQDRLDMKKDKFLRVVVCDTHQAILYRRAIIEEHNIRFTIGMKMSEDLEFQYKYLLHCKKPIQISSTLYYLRVREGSASHNPETTKNSLYGNQTILRNMHAYIMSCSDKGLAWMGIRVSNRIKNLIKAAGHLREIKHSEIQKEVRFYIDEFRKIGYKEFKTRTIKIMYLDTRLYYIFYKLQLKLSRFSLC